MSRAKNASTKNVPRGECIQTEVSTRTLLSGFFVLWIAVSVHASQAQYALHGSPTAQVDSDGDGISDELEQSLLTQFAPSFMIEKKDWSDVPSELMPGVVMPVGAGAENT